VAQEGLL